MQPMIWVHLRFEQAGHLHLQDRWEGLGRRPRPRLLADLLDIERVLGLTMRRCCWIRMLYKFVACSVHPARARVGCP